jgi:hypothetical protein
LNSVSDLVDGFFPSGELNQREKSVAKVVVILVELIQLLTWFEVAKDFHTDASVNEESDDHQNEDVFGFGQDGHERVEHFLEKFKLLDN